MRSSRRERQIRQTDTHTKSQIDITHHRLGPDEMQLRSANAIGDAAAGKGQADFFLSADGCRVVVLPVREAEAMRSDTAVATLELGAKRRCVTR